MRTPSGPMVAALAFLAATLLLPRLSAATEKETRDTDLKPGPEWKILSMFSGNDNYYSFAEQDGVPFIKARYQPPFKSAVLYHEVDNRAVYKAISWRWRAHRFPKQAAPDKDKGELDCPGGVYVLFKKGLFYRVLKYVWSVNQPPGSNYRHPKSSFFAKMHVVVLEGPPPRPGIWIEESVNPVADFRKYFELGEGDKVPALYGIGILSDGDDTKSVVETDYAGFKVVQ